jgi:hypothetical protein
MASRSQSTAGAFERGMKLLSGNMLKSMYHRLEISAIYGQANIGVVDSVSSPKIVLENYSWAPGIWVGLAKAKIDIFDPTLATLRGTYTIQSYDLLTKEITLNNVTSIVAGDVIYFEGAYVIGDGHNDMKGLHSIIEERTSLFEVSNANEPLFQGNIVNVGTDATTNAAVLSFAKVEEAVARAVEKGLSEEEITVMVNVNHWSDLLTEQTAKRSYDSSYSSNKLQQGTKVLEFFGQAGLVKIVPSTFVKEGYAYAFCEKDLSRIGSSDVTFSPPGYEGEFFKLLENASGFEIRCYSDQAIFTSRPGAMTMLRYIKKSV